MKYLYSLMACAILAACSFEADETTRTDNSAAVKAAADAQAKQAVHPLTQIGRASCRERV